MLKRCLFGLLISLLPIAVHAQTSAEFFIKLYSKTCAQFVNQPEALKRQLSQSGAPKLSAGKAAFFLNDNPGTVWVVPNVLGDFVISLDAQQRCHVFARKLDKHNAQDLFTDLVGQGPLPFSVAKLSDEQISQANQSSINVLNYRWRNLETQETVHFRLLTAVDSSAAIQAKASVLPQ